MCIRDSRTLAGLERGTLEKVADMIRQADKIVFFGSGGSLLVGKDAQHKFMKIGIRTYVYEDIDMQLMASSLLEKGDVAFCISHSVSYTHLVCLLLILISRFKRVFVYLWINPVTLGFSGSPLPF